MPCDGGGGRGAPPEEEVGPSACPTALQAALDVVNGPEEPRGGSTPLQGGQPPWLPEDRELQKDLLQAQQGCGTLSPEEAGTETSQGC